MTRSIYFVQNDAGEDFTAIDADAADRGVLVIPSQGLACECPRCGAALGTHGKIEAVTGAMDVVCGACSWGFPVRDNDRKPVGVLS